MSSSLDDKLLDDRPAHGGNLAWAAALADCSPHEVLDFSASISPLGPPSSVERAIANQLTGIVRYPTPGYGDLRRRLSTVHRVEPDCFLPGNGAAELLTWVGRELAQYQATYLFTPAFSDYRRSLKAFDATMVACPLSMADVEGGEVDWAAALEQRLNCDPAVCGLLLNTPHNPTGLLIPLALIEHWLHQFALVVVDEAFMDFLAPQAQTTVLEWINRFPNLIVLRSLTKFYSLPGLRLGYAVARPDRWHRWQQWRDPWPVNTLAEAAAIAALQDTAYQQTTWQWLPSCRAFLQQRLGALPGFIPIPGQANYLLVKVPCSGVALQLNLLRCHRIFVRDCTSFPELGDQYIRVAIRTHEENQRLVNAIADVMPLT